MIEKDHWAELIMDSIGDDPEKANEYYTQYKRWERNTLILIGITMGILCLVCAGMIFGMMYWCGVDMENTPDDELLFSLYFLWIGSIMGACCVLVKDSLEIRLRKLADNTKYYAGRIEREKGDDQCK